MVYDILAAVIVTLALLFALLAVKLLFRRGWFLAWLKGSLGLALICLGLAVTLVAWDVFHYEEILEQKPIATISFEQLEEQHFKATLVTSDGRETDYRLRGDQWQLDAKLFKWNRALAGLGLKPGYRLDRLAGRYYSLDKERNAPRTVHSLYQEVTPIDVWQLCHGLSEPLPWLEAVYGSATFVPMSDGALYEVNLTHSGLAAQPLNERAQSAVNRWQ